VASARRTSMPSFRVAARADSCTKGRLASCQATGCGCEADQLSALSALQKQGCFLRAPNEGGECLRTETHLIEN
jgi:hypothetical protein